MCIMILRYYKINRQLDAVVIVLALTQLIAILFYFFIENPMMKLGNYIIQKVNLSRVENLSFPTISGFKNFI